MTYIFLQFYDLIANSLLNKDFMKGTDIFVFILFIVIGALALFAAIFNWNWFFNTYNASFITKYIKRKGARIFYGIVGLLIIGVAFILMFA